MDPSTINAYAAAGAMAVACAVLSIFVVARGWAFMGEGISHSGFGGAGTAWMLMVLFPSLNRGEISGTLPYLFVTVFCFATAIGIGWLAAGQRVASDVAIGIFLVASLAWGFIGQNVYTATYHTTPAGFDNLLFGQLRAVGRLYAVGAVGVAVGVVACTALLWKELIAYCVDPLLARTSGVRTTFVHALLMLMLALVIVTGIRVVGSVLVTALLVLPAASANLLSRRLRTTIAISVAVGLAGAWGGLLTSSRFRAVPAGSAIVLVMFLIFLGALVASKLRRSVG